VIQVSELHYSTEDGIKVLEDIHLHVERGQFIYLVGPASSGKTLLLGLLGALIPPQRGQILVYGRNVARLSREKVLDLQRHIGFLPQGFVPLPRPVLQNVLFKLRMLGNYREQAEEKALLALEAVGLIREQATDAADLPSIERIKLGIAMALCDSPLLLLLDEPFNGLDADDRDSLSGLLARLHDGRMTIVTATRGPLPHSTGADRVVSLADGTVTEP
jgi:cell division transport system ATP-binding protein